MEFTEKGISIISEANSIIPKKMSADIIVCSETDNAMLLIKLNPKKINIADVNNTEKVELKNSSLEFAFPYACDFTYFSSL
jgi:hypothetical protein